MDTRKASTYADFSAQLLETFSNARVRAGSGGAYAGILRL
jgi:hypothetical protein